MGSLGPFDGKRYTVTENSTWYLHFRFAELWSCFSTVNWRETHRYTVFWRDKKFLVRHVSVGHVQTFDDQLLAMSSCHNKILA